jgi:hypothetical protein
MIAAVRVVPLALVPGFGCPVLPVYPVHPPPGGRARRVNAETFPTAETFTGQSMKKVPS